MHFCMHLCTNAPVCPRAAQVTIAGGVGHPAVKKLAYDLCKAVPLLASDTSLLVDGIKVWLGGVLLQAVSHGDAGPRGGGSRGWACRAHKSVCF